MTTTEIKKKLEDQNLDWDCTGKYISCSFQFINFVEAFSFMTAVALEAEKANHHPDWENSYNSVRIQLRTHDADTITQKDIDLASKINAIFKRF